MTSHLTEQAETRSFERTTEVREFPGGRLELVQAKPAVFAVFMRRREEARLANERVVVGPA